MQHFVIPMMTKLRYIQYNCFLAEGSGKDETPEEIQACNGKYVWNQDAEYHEFLDDHVIHTGDVNNYIKLPDILAFTRITITKDYRMNELYSTLQKKYKAYYYEQKKINGKNVTNGT